MRWIGQRVDYACSMKRGLSRHARQALCGCREMRAAAQEYEKFLELNILSGPLPSLRLCGEARSC
jgi:hypothetical protein